MGMNAFYPFVIAYFIVRGVSDFEAKRPTAGALAIAAALVFALLWIF